MCAPFVTITKTSVTFPKGMPLSLDPLVKTRVPARASGALIESKTCSPQVAVAKEKLVSKLY